MPPGPAPAPTLTTCPPHRPRSYAIAIGYVCFDTVDKYRKTLADARLKLGTRAMPDSVDLEK